MSEVGELTDVRTGGRVAPSSRGYENVRVTALYRITRRVADAPYREATISLSRSLVDADAAWTIDAITLGAVVPNGR